MTRFCKRSIYRLLLAALFTASQVTAAAPSDASKKNLDYTALIAKLAVLVGHADQCGSWLNDYGADALESPACKDLLNGFYANWPDRDSLREIVANEYAAVEQGLRQCDSDCADRLQRIEELRVTLTYYLDYIDFMKELQMPE